MLELDNLNKAQHYYVNSGFSLISAPWLCSGDSISSTTNAKAFQVSGKHLVGSAEQSFIEMGLHKSSGRYVATTPCFRDDFEDAYHYKYFMKTELMWSGEVGDTELKYVLSLCYNFISTLCSVNDLQIIKTPEGYDIELHGIEVGSYGIREYEGGRWVYGTGLAEPRFSNILRYKEPK